MERIHRTLWVRFFDVHHVIFSGSYGTEWNQANCTIIEFRTQSLASKTERVIYRVKFCTFFTHFRQVNVTAPNGTLISPPLGATAVAGAFGWGGYTDKRGENTRERAEEEMRDHPKGTKHPCFYSDDFLEYPAPASCKRCTDLVYFHFNQEELERYQRNWLIFMGIGNLRSDTFSCLIGGTLIGLAVVMIGLGVASLICHYKSKHRRPRNF